MNTQETEMTRTKLAAMAAVLAAWGAAMPFAPALAQDAAPQLSAGDTAWMMTSTAIVLMMSIPGLALFYCGMVRKKNVLATMMQTFATVGLVSILWMMLGYSLAFTGDGAYIGSLQQLFLKGLALDSVHSLAKTIPESVFMTFQMTFAIITCALVAGAVADRMKFSAFLWFVALWLFLVYVPVAHWVWGGGFIGAMGVLDFAGGTVVHINAGVAGLVACLVLGKRQGYGHQNMSPYNLVYAVIGAGMLWVGWFGFNAGSAVAADGRAGMAMAVTQIATAGAAVAWMFAEWAYRGKPSILGIISGAVAGLVAITPAAGFVLPGGALIIGIVSGIVCFISVVWVKSALGYDDSLDAFGVHGVGGIVGAILTGVFAVGALSATADNAAGMQGLLEGNASQVMAQIKGVVIVVIYDAIVTFIILKAIDVMVGLRVPEEVERDGLDLALHGESVQ